MSLQTGLQASWSTERLYPAKQLAQVVPPQVTQLEMLQSLAMHDLLESTV